MHFNTVAGLALSLAVSASALAAPKLPASGLCANDQYWDTAKGCTALPPPAKCSSSNQYYDSLKGCVRGQPPRGPSGLLCTIVKTLVTVARQGYPVSSFCSSYLGIPIETKSATVTAYTTIVTNTNTVTSGVTTTTDSTKTITDSTKTTTVIEPSTLTTKSTTTSTISAVSTTTIIACASPVFRKAKRADNPPAYKNDPAWVERHGIDPEGEEKRGLIPKPGAFANYVDPAAVPSTEKVTATEKATATNTETSTQVVATVYTETVTERSTTYTSTHTALSPTFTILVASGRYQGHKLYDTGYNSWLGTDSTSSPPVVFTLGDDGTLTARNGGVAGQFAVSDPTRDSYNAIPAFQPLSGNLQKVITTVTQLSDGSCPLTFQAARGSTTFECGVYWRVGSDADRASFSGCYQFNLVAIGS
ncbi:hypothetical protein ACHAPT_006380 [Fusarium lateritium]